jgi:RNA polymerase-binding transcription factor DksA
MNLHEEVDLDLVRDRLAARGAELRERVYRVRMDLGRESNPLPRDSPDAAIALENDEILEAIESTALQELERIDRAMARIEGGTFAICERCGGRIDAARQRAVAYATECRRFAGTGR